MHVGSQADNWAGEGGHLGANQASTEELGCPGTSSSPTHGEGGLCIQVTARVHWEHLKSYLLPSRPPPARPRFWIDRWGGVLLSGMCPKCPGLCGPWKVSSILLWLRSGRAPWVEGAKIEAGRGLAVGSLEWMPVCLGPVMGAPDQPLGVSLGRDCCDSMPLSHMADEHRL